MQYTNNKNGAVYEYIGIARDCTNERDGNSVMIYRGVESKKLYCRDWKEFMKKFTVVKDVR